jgi:hypothetical protein
MGWRASQKAGVEVTRHCLWIRCSRTRSQRTEIEAADTSSLTTGLSPPRVVVGETATAVAYGGISQGRAIL